MISFYNNVEDYEDMEAQRKRTEVRTPTGWYCSLRLLLGPVLPVGRGANSGSVSQLPDFSCIRVPHPRNSQPARCKSGRCRTWHLGRGIKRTDFHMWSLPVALGPAHPHHVRTRLLGRRWHFNWKHLLPFLLFLARFGLFVRADVCVQTRLHVSQEVGHKAHLGLFSHFLLQEPTGHMQQGH